MEDETWELLGSSGESPIGSERWALGKLLELAHHPSIDLQIHAVRRRSDGVLSLALLVAPADLDYVPAAVREARAATGADLIPLAIVTGSLAGFSEEWEDLGRLPQE